MEHVLLAHDSVEQIERILSAQAKIAAARESQLCKVCTNLESFNFPTIEEIITSANGTLCPGCSFLGCFLHIFYGTDTLDPGLRVVINPALGGGAYVLALPFPETPKIISIQNLIELYHKPGAFDRRPNHTGL
jgi:hypothetical protein